MVRRLHIADVMKRDHLETLDPAALARVVGGNGQRDDGWTTGGSFGGESGEWTTGGSFGGEAGEWTTGGSF